MTGMLATYAEALALSRQGALARPMFGKPRGTRAVAAAARAPIPGHYYPGTPAEFVVPVAEFHLDVYLRSLWLSPDAATREASAAVVGEFGDGSCVLVLGTVLHDDLLSPTCTLDDGTRISAAHALASIGGPEAEAALWRALETPTYPESVRTAALDGLLDLLTPDGWDSYTFMCMTRIPLPTDVRTRLLATAVPYIGTIVEMFDTAEAP